MANCLKMAMVNGIDALLEAGWSQRRIARALDIDRGTVARYARRAREVAHTAMAPPGSSGEEGAVAAEGQAANAATAPSGSRTPSTPSGSASRCEPFEAIIQAKLEIGLSAKRIHQDLVAEPDDPGSATVTLDETDRSAGDGVTNVDRLVIAA